MDNNLPPEIRELICQRDKLRAANKYSQADIIRRELESKGYSVADKSSGSTINRIQEKTGGRPENSGPGEIIVFGSGELSTTGRKIHESAIKNISPPVSIALLETPAGYEDNPHAWYRKLEKSLETGLRNFHPRITLVPALRSDGELSTNNPDILKPLLNADYIHTGAGSPSYAARHLNNSLAMKYIYDHVLMGKPLSVASAAAVAFSKYLLPVYEIYFAGHDPHWEKGLNFFSRWGLNLTFIPHWNNTEGGADIDTRFGYMGKRRFDKLLNLLPGPTTIIGIDEHTAVIFDLKQNSVRVTGKGKVTLINGDNKTTVNHGESMPLNELSGLPKD